MLLQRLVFEQQRILKLLGQETPVATSYKALRPFPYIQAHVALYTPISACGISCAYANRRGLVLFIVTSADIMGVFIQHCLSLFVVVYKLVMFMERG